MRVCFSTLFLPFAMTKLLNQHRPVPDRPARRTPDALRTADYQRGLTRVRIVRTTIIIRREVREILDMMPDDEYEYGLPDADEHTPYGSPYTSTYLVDVPDSTKTM